MQLLDVVQTWQKLNLICITSRKKLINRISGQKTGEKSQENLIFAMGIDSSKSRSNVTKVDLDLYHVKSVIYQISSQYLK